MIYSSYADWARNSNNAARFREAFALADKMEDEIKLACVGRIYRMSYIEWQLTQDLALPYKSSALSSQEQGK